MLVSWKQLYYRTSRLVNKYGTMGIVLSNLTSSLYVDGRRESHVDR